MALLIRQLALQSEGDTLCKTNAAGALLNLAQEDAFREAIGAAGGIKALVELARDGDAEGKANAAGALGSGLPFGCGPWRGQCWPYLHRSCLQYAA